MLSTLYNEINDVEDQYINQTEALEGTKDQLNELAGSFLEHRQTLKATQENLE